MQHTGPKNATHAKSNNTSNPRLTPTTSYHTQTIIGTDRCINRPTNNVIRPNRLLDNGLHSENCNCIHSIILVNTSISTNSYINLDILSSDITAIQLKGKFSHCTIFNIYNDCNNNDTTTALQIYLNENPQIALPSSTDHMLWFSNTTPSEKPTPIQHQENQKVLKKVS